MPYCISDAMEEGPRPFNLTFLTDITTLVKENCSSDLVGPNLLSLGAVFNLTTGNRTFLPGHGPWSEYSPELWLSRLIDFKLPLLVLILQVPRAAFGFVCDFRFLFHLLANPIDSIASYLYTLADCASLLAVVRRAAQAAPDDPYELLDEADCMRLTLVLIAYSTSGRFFISPRDFVDLYAANHAAFRRAARSLATDRAVTATPVLGALFGFLTAIVFKYLYIGLNAYDEYNPQHIQIWSLSSSMVMIWPVVEVFLGAIIGAPRTAESTLFILEQLQNDVPAVAHYISGPGPAETADDQKATQFDNGVVAYFRPDRWSGRCRRVDAVTTSLIEVAALVIVATGSLSAVWLAAWVPPEGGNCRTWNKAFMFGVYVFGGVMQLCINAWPRCRLSTWGRVYATAVLDGVVFVVFALNIFLTQVGILNCPGCYAVEVKDGVRGVLLPSLSWEVIQPRLKREYPLILAQCLILQFVFVAAIWSKFALARRVFMPPNEVPGVIRRMGWMVQDWAIRGWRLIWELLTLRRLRGKPYGPRDIALRPI